MLTAIVRLLIEEHVPLADIDAAMRGTGKGLLCDVIALIVTGDHAPVFTLSEDPDEMKKAITAMLLDDPSLIVIDNVVGRLQSKHLEGVLTSQVWGDRLLGGNKMVKVPHKATWIATGNNLQVGGDLPTRTYRIQLDQHSAHPELSDHYTIKDLPTWVLEHRAELVRALLILARAWYVAGCPLDETLPSMRSFTNWIKVLGGILKHAGVPGFLGNLDAKRGQSSSAEAMEWEAFLSAWHTRFGDTWASTAEISAALTQANSVAVVPRENDQNLFLESLPEWLQVALKEKPNSFKLRLAKALEKLVNACFGEENLRLERTIEKHSKKVLWRVLRGSAGVSFPPRVGENLEGNFEMKEEIAYGVGGMRPPQTPANGPENGEPKTGTGSTGGSAQMEVKEDPQKNGEFGDEPPQPAKPFSNE